MLTLDFEAAEKAAKLGNSIPFDFHCWSDDPGFDAMVDTFWHTRISPELRGQRNSQKEGKRYLKVILANLYSAFAYNQERYVAYPRNKNDFPPQNRYNPLKIGYANTIKTINALIKFGFIESVLGFYDRSRQRTSKRSRMRATGILATRFTNQFNYDPTIITRYKAEELIVLRDYKVNDKKKAPDIDYRDNHTTLQMRKNLQKINAGIQSGVALLKVSDESWHKLNAQLANDQSRGLYSYDGSGSRRSPIDYSRVVLRRIFNDKRTEFDRGGRFYGGWWQQIPKKYRKYITINDGSTCEIDYSGMHLNIIHVLENIPTPEGYDPYTLAGHDGNKPFRDLVKQIVLRIINADDRGEVIGSLENDSKKKDSEKKINLKVIPKSIGSLDALLSLIEDKHSDIKDAYFYSDKGKELQYHDSKLAEQVMLDYYQYNIPLLPLHDSFIVKLSTKDILKSLMRKHFKEMFGRDIKLDMKVTSLEAEQERRQEEFEQAGGQGDLTMQPVSTPIEELLDIYKTHSIYYKFLKEFKAKLGSQLIIFFLFLFSYHSVTILQTSPLLIPTRDKPLPNNGYAMIIP